MKLQQTIALVALLTAIIASLLFAPLSQARIAPGNPGFEGDRILVDGTPYDVTLEESRAIVSGIAYELGVEDLGVRQQAVKTQA